MDRLKLVLPTAADEQAIWDYREEFLNNNDQHLDGTGGLADAQDFTEWYRKNLAYRSEETTPPDKVPASTYLAVLQQTGELIGMIDIRHRLNEGLLKFGGHIGYSVRPSRRRQGYAVEMLRLGWRSAASSASTGCCSPATRPTSARPKLSSTTAACWKTRSKRPTASPSGTG